MIKIEEYKTGEVFSILFNKFEKFGYWDNYPYPGKECFIRLTKSDLELLYSCLSEKINKVEKPEINFLPIDTHDN